MSARDAEIDYAQLVMQAQKCEVYAAAAPIAYRWRVAALALFGYLMAPAILIALIALFLLLLNYLMTTGSGGVEFAIGYVGIGLVVTSVMVLRAMCPKFGQPEGLLLKPKDAPDLFAFLEEVRVRAGRPRVNRVFLTDELNASVWQTPRLGLLGWYRNDLCLGLPLLQALNREEFASVVAHEFAHLSGRHGKIGAWIYRTRRIMARMRQCIDNRYSFGSGTLYLLYNWYTPYFSAYSFVLARGHEYEADSVSAEVTSGEAAVGALVRLQLADDYIQEAFWADVWQQADRQPEPPRQVYARLGEELGKLADWPHTRRALHESLSVSTDYGNTHPCLSDRAQALGIEPQLPGLIEDSAIELLPDHGAAQIEALSEQWREAVAENWAETVEQAKRDRQELDGLDETAKSVALSKDDALDRIQLALRFLGAEAALVRAEQSLDAEPESQPLLFAKGRLLLSLDRDEGLALLDEVMETEGEAILTGCELAEDYLRRHGRHDEADAYRRRREEKQERLEIEMNERFRVGPDDDLLAHDCDAESLTEVLAVVEHFSHRGLKVAHLLRKVTRNRPWEPVHILVCEFGVLERWMLDPDEMEEMAAEINDAIRWDGDIWATICEVGDGWLAEKARAVDGGRIFPRD